MAILDLISHVDPSKDNSMRKGDVLPDFCLESLLIWKVLVPLKFVDKEDQIIFNARNERSMVHCS
jgi:hypothetical protein